ncbi:MAG: hypothetical protein R6U29_08285 [Desulfosudaceae bacterium]
MVGWTAKRYKLPNMNFEATAIRFEDGGVGLSYHGTTIWQEGDSRWDESVRQDWQKIWKYGRICSFSELPADMRRTCPKCGQKINPDDQECPNCGVIFSKARAATEGDPMESGLTAGEDQTDRPHSRIIDLALIIVALIIAGLILFYLFRPRAPEEPVRPSRSIPAEQNVREAPPASSETSLSGETSPSGIPDQTEHPPVEAPSPAETPADESQPASSEKFYSHINLDDQAAAREELQKASAKIMSERRKIEEEQARVDTTAERRALELKIETHNARLIELKKLIRTYNKRYGKDQ